MSAKLLYSLSDENRDLQKQIGCMNGIFQLFHRHHVLSRRRVHQNQKMLPAPGQSDSHGTKPNGALQLPTEKNPTKKAVKKQQKISTESSRTSFSSSSGSSSFSSIDNKHSQTQSFLYGQTNFPRTPSRDLPVYQPNNSLQSSRQPVGIRAVVKDSMYRETREISIKTATKGNVGGQTLKYMDSPRPLQQPKSVKSKVWGPNESFPVLSKPREDGFVAKDAPRFSYDERELRGLKSTIKLKEPPRLSLDSKERSTRDSTTEMISNHLLGDLQRINGNSYNILNQRQEPGNYGRPSSVVVKLMGLEAFPDSKSTNGDQPNQTKTFPDAECDSFTRLSRTDENKQNQISSSPRNSIREAVSPRMKNVNSVKKPVARSKFPIEPAPWKQPDGNKEQTPALKGQDSLAGVPNFPISVYGEIEKRLAQLEFQKSGKDLRALKQILEAMQKSKETLEIRREDQASNFVSQTGNNNSVDQNSKLGNSENLKRRYQASSSIKGTGSPKSFRSPIVIMKSAKPIERASNSASSATQNEGLAGLRRIRIGNSPANRKESVDKQTKDSTPRSNRLRDLSSQPLHLTNKKTSAKSLRSVQTSKSSQTTTGKNKSGKSSESMKPRLQQKELRLEKQSHSRTLSLDLSRSREQPTESGSPHKKSSPKCLHRQPRDDQLSDISTDTRDLSQQGDTSSLQSESYVSMASNVNSEVTSIDRSYKISSAFLLQHSKKDPPAGCTEDRSMAEPVRAGPEQPSPVSVLDATFYADEPPSPVKKISHAFKDDETLNSEEAEWSLMDLNHLYNSREPSFRSENDYNKLVNMKHFNQDDMNINPTQVVPIYAATDLNHIYISEIMLASGVLRDFDSDFMTLQLDPSGHLINPNLFYVLEQTKARTRVQTDKNEGKKITRSVHSTEKTQRKLIFDAVNEILVHKLLSQESSKILFSPRKMADKRSSEKQLLRNLCSEVDRLQANNSNCNLDDEDDILRSIVCQDLMHGSMDWTVCQSEVSQLVLYVERLIFKDLISEIVREETSGLLGHPGRYCRVLFSK